MCNKETPFRDAGPACCDNSTTSLLLSNDRTIHVSWYVSYGTYYYCTAVLNLYPKGLRINKQTKNSINRMEAPQKIALKAECHSGTAVKSSCGGEFAIWSSEVGPCVYRDSTGGR